MLYSKSPEAEEPALSVSEARFGALLDTCMDGVVVVDEAGRILAFNRGCELMFGYGADDAIGMNVSLIISVPNDGGGDSEAAAVTHGLVSLNSGDTIEILGRHLDGTIFPVEISVGETKTTAGRQYIGVLRDLRPRRTLELRITQMHEQANRLAKNGLGPQAEGSIREILQPVKGLKDQSLVTLEWVREHLDKEALGADLISAALVRIQTEATKVENLLLALGRNSGPTGEQVAGHDLRQIIESFAESMNSKSGKTHRFIECSFGDSQVIVDLDPGEIQALLECIQSIAYDGAVGPEFAQLLIHVDVEGARSKLAVHFASAGPTGLSESARSSVGQLARLAGKMGREANVADGPDGVVVKIFFPHSSGSAGAMAATSSLPSALPGGTILMIDRNEDLTSSLADIFAIEGYNARVFDDVTAFLNAVRTEKPLALLINFRLRDRTGIDLLRSLDPASFPAPIFMTSAAADVPLAVQAIKLGAVDVIERPFVRETMVARIRDAISAMRARNPTNGESASIPGAELLTPREREVLREITGGASNKEAGRRLGISPRTIEVHRARIMEKLGARNAADLVRIVLTSLPG